MSDRKMCYVVRDLLPLYVDGLTSDASNKLVTEHLDSCEECRKIYQRMAEPEPEMAGAYETPEIDYLKKTKKRGIRILMLVIAAAVCVLLAGFAAFFCRKIPLAPEEFVAEVSVEEEGGMTSVRAEGTLIETYRYRGCRFEETGEGIIHLTIEGSPSFISNNDRTFDTSCSMNHDVRQVWIGDLLVWEDGNSIPTYVSKLYSAHIPYVGDNVGVGNILSALGLSSSFGDYTFELQTGMEPYGLTVRLSEPLAGSREESAAIKLRGYACVLLALIDNLGEASFEYTLDGTETSFSANEAAVGSNAASADDHTKTHIVTVTAEEAGKMAGYDIKDTAKSAVTFKQMLTDLDLIDNYVSVKYPGDSFGVRLSVILNTKKDINYVSLDLLANGESISTQGVIHADETAWTPGETVDFELLRENFASAGSINNGDSFTVQISLENADGTFSTKPLSLIYRDGAVYETVLSENTDGGYTLSAK